MTAIRTARETYPLSPEGFITRAATPNSFSGQWRLVGAVRRNNFGHRVDFIPFPACLSIKDWRHKNGGARWRIRDFDHGTTREWGETVCGIDI